MAVYFSVLKPGDKMLTMDLSHGGHLTHGNKANFSGKFFEIVHYGVRKDDETIDYDQLQKMAEEHRPRMITVGASAYSRIIDFKRMGEIARSKWGLICWPTSPTSRVWSRPDCIPARQPRRFCDDHHA
jgi:glycine hydroxymethyltransferase